MIFLENSSVLGVFWLRRGLQANHGTVRKSAKSPQPGNQKQVKWSNTVYFNKRSFNFKIKFCVFQVTKAKFCMKVIRIFNAQPVKIPILRARWRVNKHGDPIFLLHFFMFISWMLIIPSFKKSLIVEQFQGNYLKDDIKRFKAIEENDSSQFNDKPEWIKFTVMNFYEWYKQREFMHTEINRISMKAVHVKMRELREHATERNFNDLFCISSQMAYLTPPQTSLTNLQTNRTSPNYTNSPKTWAWKSPWKNPPSLSSRKLSV